MSGRYSQKAFVLVFVIRIFIIKRGIDVTNGLFYINFIYITANFYLIGLTFCKSHDWIGRHAEITPPKFIYSTDSEVVSRRRSQVSNQIKFVSNIIS